MVQILCLLMGAFALVKKSIQFSSTQAVQGTNAQIVGGLLLLAGLISMVGPAGLPMAIALLVGAIVFAFLKKEEIQS